MAKDKNSIDEVIKMLQEMEPLPYREGAWENFRDKHLVPEPRAAKSPAYAKWAAIAASALLFATAGYFWTRTPNLEGDLGLSSQQEMGEEFNNGLTEKSELEERKLPSKEIASAPKALDYPLINELEEELQEIPVKQNPIYVSKAKIGPLIQDELEIAEYRVEWEELGELRVDRTISPAEWSKNDSNRPLVDPAEYWASQQIHERGYEEPLSQSSAKQFRLSDKMAFGLVVAPSATQKAMHFGGGVSLSYKLSNRLNIRTGLSFQQFEVGRLTDPKNSEVQTAVRQSSSLSQVQHDLNQESGTIASAGSSRVTIPNINALSGSTKTLDIPVELQFNVGKEFYFAGGVSYALVLNQDRYAHYIDNVHSAPFSYGSEAPSSKKELEQSVKAVAKKVKTQENSVDENGFGGFVNFSAGKQINLPGSKFKLSIEPYIKLPVGNFRKSEMDYTNKGIRIITSF